MNIFYIPAVKVSVIDTTGVAWAMPALKYYISSRLGIA
jgi:hypothetical protein